MSLNQMIDVSVVRCSLQIRRVERDEVCDALDSSALRAAYAYTVCIAIPLPRSLSPSLAHTHTVLYADVDRANSEAANAHISPTD